MGMWVGLGSLWVENELISQKRDAISGLEVRGC